MMENNEGRPGKRFQVKDQVSRSRPRYAEVSAQYESLKLRSADEEKHLKGTETTLDYVTQSGKSLVLFFPPKILCVRGHKALAKYC